MGALAFVEHGEFETTRAIDKERLRAVREGRTGGEMFMDERGESNGNRIPKPGTSEGNRYDSYQAVAGGR